MVQPSTPISKLEAQYWHPTGLLGLYSRVTLRTTQFLLALILIGLYSPDLTHASATSSRVQTPWIIAIITCVLSALTCIIHVFITAKRVALVCFWDAVLMVVWAAVTGTFGVIFISEGRKDEAVMGFTENRRRMVVAVWGDLVMMVLWGASAVQGCVWCCVARRVTRGTVVPRKDSEVEEGKALDNEEAVASVGLDHQRVEELEMQGLAPVERNSEDAQEKWKAFGKVGEGLKKFESPPPTYARFSV